MKSSDVDQRLGGVLQKVMAGEFYETTLELFRITYFPALSDLETIDVLGQWCARQAMKPDLHERRVDLGGKIHMVVYLVLTRS